MTSFAFLVFVFLSFAAADPAATECREGVCEVDEMGLLQRGVPYAANDLLVQQLAGTGDNADAERGYGHRWSAPRQRRSVLSFQPDDIGKALEIGTGANIGPNFDTSVLDLTGIWYILWEPSSSAVKFYMSLRLEIAVTFAGAKISGYSHPNSSFHMSMPGQMPKHWAYSDSLSSDLQMFAHAIAWPYCQDLSYKFENNRHAFIEGIGPFIYLNDDQWQRPTETPAGTFTYKLSRIVYANGTKTKFYDDYRQLMNGYRIKVWADTDQYARCEGTEPVIGMCRVMGDAKSCQS
mmetsp:Transcript_44718/g.127632  ORF Transcript_44718/g.127632 Transcript_44718/m.127632 type:complete len:292 (-) Transcript_44718:162-1037(-)